MKRIDTCPIHNRGLAPDGSCKDCGGVPQEAAILRHLMEGFRRETLGFQDRLLHYLQEVERVTQKKGVGEA